MTFAASFLLAGLVFCEFTFMSPPEGKVYKVVWEKVWEILLLKSCTDLWACRSRAGMVLPRHVLHVSPWGVCLVLQRDDLSAGLAAAGYPHLTGRCIKLVSVSSLPWPKTLGPRGAQAAPPALPQQEGLVTAADGGEACLCSLDKVLCLLLQMSVNKWWRMLDHIVAGTCERGRDPALGPFFKIICSGCSYNSNLGREKDVLGRSCSSGICLQLCVLQSIFKREVLKLTYCSWNLKCWFWGLFVSANCLRITSFPFCDSKLNESFNKLYENWVSLFS